MRFPRRVLLSAAAVGVVVAGTGVIDPAPSSASGTSRWVAYYGTDSANTCQSAGNPCATISHAVSVASSGDTINLLVAGTLFDNVTIPSSLTNLTISNGYSGPGDQGVVDGNNAGRVFTIQSGASVTIDNLIIQNGASTYGAGIDNAGTLVLNDDTIQDNSSVATQNVSPQDEGGGIYNSGSLTVNSTEIANNSAGSAQSEGWGGAIDNDGIAFLHGDLLMSNIADGAGGGLYSSSGSATLLNVTITGNQAGYPNPDTGGGGGVATQGGTVTLINDTVVGDYAAGGDEVANAFGGTISVESSIVGAYGDLQSVCSTSGGPITDSGYNLSIDASCGFTSSTSRQGVNPDLEQLGNYGGQTETEPPVPNSPAVDQIPSGSNCPTTDQRGSVRPQGPACDIGAVEIGPIASDQGYSTKTNKALSIPAGQLTLVTDANPGASPFTAQLVSGPSHGSLTLNTDGSFTYTPNSGYAGFDSFTYTVTDNLGFVSDPQTVNLFVGFYIPSPISAGFPLRWSFSTTLPEIGGKAPYTWKVISGTLPAGLTLSTRGVLSGKATKAGSIKVTVQATNSNHLVASGPITIEVVPNLYVSDLENSDVVEWSPATGMQRTVATGLTGPNGVALDASGNLYVSESSGIVAKITPTGTTSTYISGLNAPSRVAVDVSGDVFVADTGNNDVVEKTAARVTKVVVSNLSGPIGVATDSKGNVYITQEAANNILKVTPSGTQSTITASFSQANGIASDKHGDLWIADWGSSTIQRISKGGLQFNAGVTGLNHPNDVAFDALSDDLYVADHDLSEVVLYTGGGVQSVVPLTGLSGPNSVAVG